MLNEQVDEMKVCELLKRDELKCRIILVKSSRRIQVEDKLIIFLLRRNKKGRSNGGIGRVLMGRNVNPLLAK